MMTWISRNKPTRRDMRSAAILALVLMAGAAATYGALPFLVSDEKLREALAAHAETWSGGELQLSEDVDVSLGRGPSMTVEDAKFLGAVGGAEWWVDVASLHATFRLLPLLTGKVEIETLTLDGPQLRFRDRSDPAGATMPETAEDGPDFPRAGGEVIVTNASFSYEGPTGRQFGVGDIDLRMTADPDSPAVLVTGAVPAGKGRLHLQGRFENPAAAFSGSSSEVRLALRAAVTAEDAGTPPPPPPSDVPAAAQEGQVASALRRFAAAVGLSGSGPIAMEGHFAVTPRAFSLNDATVSFGGLLAEGNLTVSLDGERSPFDELESVVRKAGTAWREAASAVEAGVWREAPVKLDWLAPLDVELAARLRDSRLSRSDLEADRIRIEAGGGRAKLEVSAIGDLGRLRGELTVGAGSVDSMPRIAFRGGLDHLDMAEAGRMILAFAPPPLVSPPQLPEGTLDAHSEVTTQGETLGDMLIALDGFLAAEAQDGTVTGADVTLTLEDLAQGREIMTEKDGPLIPAAGRTQFDIVKARVEFGEGEARLTSFTMRGERYDIDMNGEADLQMGAMRAEGQARLRGTGSDEGGDLPLVDLPFGIGGTITSPIVAAGVPRSGTDLTSEDPIAEGGE